MDLRCECKKESKDFVGMVSVLGVFFFRFRIFRSCEGYIG